MSYRPRIVDDELDELLPDLSAIVLDGPRGVGKTATGTQRADTVFNLDTPDTRQAVFLNYARLAEPKGTVFIDEWQRLPPVWDFVRRQVDQHAPAGKFLLAGSTLPLEAPAHTGAGRIVHLRMRPLSLAERDLAIPTVSLAELLKGTRPAISGESPVTVDDYAREIVCSGLPGIRGLRPRARTAQLDGYLTNALTRDFAERGVATRNPEALYAWLAAYGAASSTCANYTTIMEAATPGQADKPAKNTTLTYRSALAQLWLTDPVPGWQPNHNRLTRLATGAKHHLADPALAARLLDVDAEALLSGGFVGPSHLWNRNEGTLLGNLFESLVTLSVRTYAQAANGRVYHLRTHNSAQEVDLIVTGRTGRVLALEVKLAAFADDGHVKHLRWLRSKLGEQLLDAAVITAGPLAYRRDDGIAVIPAALLGP